MTIKGYTASKKRVNEEEQEETKDTETTEKDNEEGGKIMRRSKGEAEEG
jgi:hypothetical protein